MKIMKKSTEKYIRYRTIFIGFVFTAVFLVIICRIVYLQIFIGANLSEKAAEQYESVIRVTGKRGSIFDAKNKELAISIKEKSICAYPKLIKDKSFAASNLAEILNLKKKDIYNKLTSDRKFVWIQRQVSSEQADKIEKLKISGIDFIQEFTRFYPGKTIAAQVIGLSGLNSNGLEGLEFFYDDYLKGSLKETTIKKDGRGKWFEPFEYFKDFSGCNIFLTIDTNIQYTAEKYLKKAVDEYGAKAGIAVVMDPFTGAILAFANYPFFNPNFYSKYDRIFWRNRIVTDAFEPGSVMKMFLAAIAIDSGKCNKNSLFFCENGSYKINDNIFIRDAYPKEWLSLSQIIKYSNNIGAAKISEAIGGETLYNGLKNFGFGEKTDIDFPGETSGILRYYKEWTRFDACTIAFGQGMSASGIQLAAAASAIVNGGFFMKPYIVKKIVGRDGSVVKENFPRSIRRAISSETAKIMKNILQRVTEKDGTGSLAAIDDYTVCGKTGTAQKASNQGGYEKGKYVASFLGFVISEKPEFTILVSLDEPKKNYYGGIIAAPVFKEIAEDALTYLNVPKK